MSGTFIEALVQAQAEIVAERARTGGPAFPFVALGDPNHPASEPGMLLRDYFAGQALAGMMADPATFDVPPEVIARSSYRLADAMLLERAKEPGA